MASINFEQFSAIELRVGRIAAVEHIEKSDKLYKLTVDFGECGQRTICAGIKQFYMPEALLGIQAVFAYNLEPRVLRGVESAGMILMARTSENKPVLIQPNEPVAAGARLA